MSAQERNEELIQANTKQLEVPPFNKTTINEMMEEKISEVHPKQYRHFVNFKTDHFKGNNHLEAIAVITCEKSDRFNVDTFFDYILNHAIIVIVNGYKRGTFYMDAALNKARKMISLWGFDLIGEDFFTQNGGFNIEYTITDMIISSK